MAQPTHPTDDGGGQDRSDVAQQKGREVAGHAEERGRQVADTARDQANRVVGEARRQTGAVVAEAGEQAREQARHQTDRAGSALRDLGERAHALADGRPEEAGPLPEYADRLASQVDDLAARVNELGFDGILQETQRFARRRPGAFLLGAAAAGFAISRLGRGAKDADTSGSTDTRMQPTGRTDVVPRTAPSRNPTPPVAPSQRGLDRDARPETTEVRR